MTMFTGTYKSNSKRPRTSSILELSKMVDLWLVGATLLLLTLGLVMMSSASIGIADRMHGQPLYFVIRQAGFLAFGLICAMLVFALRLHLWEKISAWLLLGSFLLLILVLVPGIGKEVNGSSRWIALGFMNFQVSELVKLFVIVALAGYLVKQGELVRTSVKGFLWPLAVLGVISVLLLLEPDLGATAVIAGTVLGLLFIAGVKLWQFAVLISIALAGLVTLIITSPYRFERLRSFVQPCAEEFVFDKGYQLCQALIAFGRGEWAGVGLGAGVQKLFYLPEAHTDFVLAVLAEELGVVGTLTVIALFAVVVVRAFMIGHRAEANGYPFAAYLAYGISLWIGLQAFVNIGVNMGVLPTKGLTLPLMSYGGSSLVVSCIAIGLLMRVDFETRFKHSFKGKGVGIW